ncbi:MAG TPA: serine hydrolase domain-containing protein [Aliidongia sp.]|nr:serine hydrolase domain-containing protein [Aliidongia sp.]
MSDATLPVVDPAEVGLSAERLARISGILKADVARDYIPGAVLLIARNGKIAHFDAIGRRDPAAAEPMAKDSIFRIYSMTKPIVSTAVMMLFEEGHFLLSDPVAKYIPEFASLQVGTEVRDPTTRKPMLQLAQPRRPMTIQDLLRHTSGLTYGFMGETLIHKLYQEQRIDGHRGQSNEEMVAKLAKIPLQSHPGTRWEYSVSVDVQGRLVEVISGRTLGQFLKERLFTPLGMKDSGFHVPDYDHHRIAEPFPTDPETGAKVELHSVLRAPRFESGGGGMVSTALDYARFLQMTLNGGILDGKRYLSRKTIELMSADHLGEIPGIEAFTGPGFGFGLGYAVRMSAGLAGHAGSKGNYFWGGAAGTRFFIDPSERLFAVLMIQAPGQREHYSTSLSNMVYSTFDD